MLLIDNVELVGGNGVLSVSNYLVVSRSAFLGLSCHGQVATIFRVTGPSRVVIFK